MELGTDYIFRDDMFDAKAEGTTCPIELKIDPFAGIVYRYTTVKFRMDNDIPKMMYDYDIIKTNDLSMITLRKNEKFNQTLGLILNGLLLDAAEIEESIENRTNDNQESDSQRDIHEEGSSIS